MHPYRNLLSVEQEILSNKLITALRGIATVEIIFGSAIVGLELAANALNQDADIFTSVLGVWAGFITILTGIAAYTNSRITSRIHPIHSTFLALGHTFTSAFAAVSTLGVFGLRCISLRALPGIKGEHIPNKPITLTGTADQNITIPPDTINLVLLLEYTLIVLYIINFMVLGVSFGVSGAVMRAVRQARLLMSVPDMDDHETDVQLQSSLQTQVQVSAPVREEKKTKVQILTDLEATADGFYRRLEEEPEDMEIIERETA